MSWLLLLNQLCYCVGVAKSIAAATATDRAIEIAGATAVTTITTPVEASAITSAAQLELRSPPENMNQRECKNLIQGNTKVVL